VSDYRRGSARPGNWTVLVGNWTVLVVGLLGDGAKRFTEKSPARLAASRNGW